MVRLELMVFKIYGCWSDFISVLALSHGLEKVLEKNGSRWQKVWCVCFPSTVVFFPPRTSTLEVHPWSVPYGLVVGRRFGRGNTLGGTSKDEPGNRGHNVATVIGWIRATPLVFLVCFYPILFLNSFILHNCLKSLLPPYLSYTTVFCTRCSVIFLLALSCG